MSAYLPTVLRDPAGPTGAFVVRRYDSRTKRLNPRLVVWGDLQSAPYRFEGRVVPADFFLIRSPSGDRMGLLSEMQDGEKPAEIGAI